MLTVMSPAGARAALEAIETKEGIITHASDGYLTQYLERREGALRRLIARHAIVGSRQARMGFREGGAR